MPRKKLILSADMPYHITNRSNNREFFYIDKNLLWLIFLECLNELTIQFKCNIHCFVLMSNHYHLLISTPEANIGEAMKYLHREVARKSNRSADRINHFFGGRYRWSLVNTEDYYWNSIKYIFRNPIRAGICKKVEEYKFSSLNRKPDSFQWCLSDIFHVEGKEIELDSDWLNEPFSKESEEAIGKALRRREFKLPRNAIGKLNILEKPRYRK